MIQHKVVVVIFAGGSGKRLWPLSTASAPKQINHTFSKDSMVVEAYHRAQRHVAKENILVVTTRQLLAATKKLLPLDKKNFIVQPKNADTAAAMSVAAMYLETQFPESIAVYMYSDHYIADEDKFDKAIADAVQACAEDRLVIIGTRPTFANTEFGYIRMGGQSSPHLYEVADFKEKPKSEDAQKLVASGQWLWNTGIKVWNVSALLQAIKAAHPEMYNMLVDLRGSINSDSYWQAFEAWYNSIEPSSFEAAIAAKLPKLYVLEADYHWEDIGNWQTIYKMAQKDENGNVVKRINTNAPVNLVDTKNTLVMSATQQKIAVINVDDVIIVQTSKALLICKKEKAADIKAVAE